MLKVCDGCTTAYAADLEACPHCLATGYRWNYEEPPPPVKAKKAAP